MKKEKLKNKNISLFVINLEGNNMYITEVTELDPTQWLDNSQIQLISLEYLARKGVYKITWRIK